MFANIHTDILRLSERYAAAQGLRLSTVSLYACGQGRLLHRLRAGHDITTRRAARVIRWLSDHWPADTEWPADIPRPPPSPDAPPPAAPDAPPPCADPVAEIRALRARMLDARDAGDMDEMHRLDAEAQAVGMRLDPATGEIASPAALRAAMGVASQRAYEYVIEQYADGRPRAGRRPRRYQGYQPSDTERVWTALVASGDARFTSRRPRQAA